MRKHRSPLRQVFQAPFKTDAADQEPGSSRKILISDDLLPSYAPCGAGIPSTLQIPLAVALLIVACLGTGACDCVRGFTQMS